MGKTVIGIEPDFRSDEPLQWHLVRMAVPPIPLDDQSVDTAVLFDVLEHVDDDEALLTELRRVTRRRLIMSVPSDNDGPLPRYGLCLLHHIDKTHRREYALATLEALLLKHGFAVRWSGQAAPHGASQLVTEFFIDRWYAKPFRWATGAWIRALRKTGLVKVDLAADWLLVADTVAVQRAA
jgi:SAM-dependent methyltransferase